MNQQTLTAEPTIAPAGSSPRSGAAYGSALRPKYRIVTDRFCGYEVQERHWWGWSQVGINTSPTPEEAEAWLHKRLAKSKAGIFTRFIFAPNEDCEDSRWRHEATQDF